MKREKCNAICPPYEHKHKDGTKAEAQEGYYPKPTCLTCNSTGLVGKTEKCLNCNA